MFLFKSMVYAGLSSCQTSRPASREASPNANCLSQEVQIFVITNIYFKPVFTDFINMAEPSTSTVSIYLHNYQFK